MKSQTGILLYAILLILFSGSACAGDVLANNDIQLTGSDSKRHALSEYIGKGRWTVVNLWGVDCPPCREEMPELVLLHDEYSTSLVTVLGIAIDFPSFGYPNKGEVNQFLQDFMVDFPVLLSDASIAVRLGAGDLQGLPTTYIYTPEGELVAQQVGAITRKLILEFIQKHQLNRSLEKIRNK